MMAEAPIQNAAKSLYLFISQQRRKKEYGMLLK
jgi:hypothetical protein